MRGRGDLAAAIRLADETRSRLAGSIDWVADLLGVESAETRLARGEPDRAISIVAGLADSSDPAAVLELARAHFARGDDTATRRALPELAAGPATAPSILVGGQLLQAALEIRAGERHRARTTVAAAVRLAEPEALRRPFLEAPKAVRRLLAEDAGRIRPEAISGEELIQPLTAKEREVLAHLSELLTTEEIADAMFVSVNTVRTHVRSILRKLSVSRRNEAVRRARALSLIG
jgi:LuxR family maltose regulon positive regulatory protein